MGQKLLATHMNDENKTKVISETLNTKFYHHGYPLARTEAKEIGLSIAEPNEKIENLMWNIYEDFMEDRAIKMFKDDELNYFVYVQVFTTDNLPFSPITGDKKHIFFDYDQAATDGVAISDVCGNKFNQVTQKYEVTDHT